MSRAVAALVMFAIAISAGASTSIAQSGAVIVDASHFSEVFGELRNYRVFLPPSYAQSSPKRYPVVYFFHGSGERYNRPSAEVGDYDTGYNGDNISSYVATHDLIVVKWDGFNPRFAGDTYTRPYNIGPVETARQFPLYFPELVRHIDATYRTIADRNYRGTSGVSMGGFMSYWIAGKYPDLVNSASSFMGSPEFFVGALGYPSEYSHAVMHRNYAGVRTRLVTGTQDFIRWYHGRMNAIWRFTRSGHEVQEYVSAHGTPGMRATLDFHLKAFAAPAPPPAVWDHADVYSDFDVWGYSVSSDRRRAGFTVLEDVRTSGFRSSVREWLPTGRLLPAVTLRIATAAVYESGRLYFVTDVNLDTGQILQLQQAADANGRLHFSLSGHRHEVGISPARRPIVTVEGWRLVSSPLTTNGRPVALKLEFVNKGALGATGITAQVQSDPAVEILAGTVTVPTLAAGASAEGTEELRFIVHDPTREIVQLRVRIDVAGTSVVVPLEVPVFADAPAMTNLVVNDGATTTMWQHAVSTVSRALGTGNRDGRVNPGETVPMLLLDGSAYRAGEMFTFDPCVDMGARVSDYWGTYDHVGASVKYSLPLVTTACPPGRQITFFVRYQIPNGRVHILKTGVVTATVAAPPASEVILDNGRSGTSFVGTWLVSTALQPYGANSLYSAGTGRDTYRWRPTLSTTRNYAVYVWWTSHVNRSTRVPYTIVHADGTFTTTRNQQTGGGQWQLLGTFRLAAGTAGYVEVSDANGQAGADAVRFVPR